MDPLTVQLLDRDAFRPFGDVAPMIDPDDERLGAPPVEFFRDQIQQDLGTATSASFSCCRIESREPVITVLECHSRTAETMMPIDNDMVLFVAPASAGEPELERLTAFHVPRGTVVVMRPGVWHHGPFTPNDRPVHILCALPERTYANDTTTVELAEEQQRQVAITGA